MTKFLKGDATAAITLALADGFDYSGKTVHLEYQGARRSFSGVAAGGSLTFSFTAAETAPMSLGAYPVRVWMEDENGGITTIKNADVKLCVTDSAADVHSDGAIYLDVRGGLYGIEGLPERYTDEDLRRKIHEILRRLGGTVAAFALAILPAFGAIVDVQTAPKGTIYNDEQVVTNVVLDVSDLATTGNVAVASAAAKEYTDAAISGKQDALPYPTNAIPWTAVSQRPNMDEYATTGQLATAVGAIPAPDFTVSNDTLVATIEATAPAPGNYATVSNRAMNAVQQSDYNYSRVYFRPTDPIPGTFSWIDWHGMSINFGESNTKYLCENIENDGATLNLPTTSGMLALTSQIPTNTSQLVNGAGYATLQDAKQYTDGVIASSLTNYATRTELDTGWWSKWTYYDENGKMPYQPPQPIYNPTSHVWLLTDVFATPLSTSGEEDATELLWDISDIVPGAYYRAFRWRVAAPVPIKTSDLTNDIGYLTAEYDPTVSAWAKAESKPTYNAGEVGAYSAADGTNLANVVNLWEGYWDGTNVIFEVTNYYGNTSGELPRLRIKELREGAWHTVWDEANKFAVCETQIVAIVAASNAVCRAGCAADLATGLAGRAPLAWGTVTDKGSPNVVSNSVWMTAPETYFAGGTEYQRVAVGSGTICVLVDNGAGTYTAGEAGTFRFQDEGGTNYFGFAKSDSYTIGCRTDGITVSGTLVTLRYDVIMGGTDVPIVYYRQSLASGEWVQLNNADGTATQGAPYTVTWYTSGGSYYAAINCGENSSGFFKAETSVAGDVVFETNMKARLDGGIECPNTATGVMGVIRPTFNGSTVIWNWSAR